MATHDDDLDTAARFPDTLRAQPIADDRIRIVFTREDGRDTR